MLTPLIVSLIFTYSGTFVKFFMLAVGRAIFCVAISGTFVKFFMLAVGRAIFCVAMFWDLGIGRWCLSVLELFSSTIGANSTICLKSPKIE